MDEFIVRLTKKAEKQLDKLPDVSFKSNPRVKTLDIYPLQLTLVN